MTVNDCKYDFDPKQKKLFSPAYYSRDQGVKCLPEVAKLVPENLYMLQVRLSSPPCELLKCKL